MDVTTDKMAATGTPEHGVPATATPDGCSAKDGHVCSGHVHGAHVQSAHVANHVDCGHQALQCLHTVLYANAGMRYAGSTTSSTCAGAGCGTLTEEAASDVTMTSRTMGLTPPLFTVSMDVRCPSAARRGHPHELPAGTPFHGDDSECAGAADLMMNAHDRSRRSPEAEMVVDAQACGEDGDEEVEEEEEEEEEEGRVGPPRQCGTRILRHRSTRRPIHERFRQKRQTLQDMARPLKHWLYRHRANPYPTREEKTQLARKSAMTLTQVSNWFANARRRLKNTVQDPSLSWGRRIKLYNSCVEGNAERLSICSDDEDGPTGEQEDDMWASDRDSPRLEEHPVEQAQQVAPLSSPLSAQHAHHFPRQDGNEADRQPDYDPGVHSDDGSVEDTSGQRRKYKAAILQRYLQDPCEVQPAGGDRRRHPSGSLSSHDYEEWSSSSCSSPSHVFEDQFDGLEVMARQLQSQVPSDDMSFKEISAALALTTLKYRGRNVRP